MAGPSLAGLRVLLAAGYVVSIYVFMYLPVVVLVVFSFQDGTLPAPPFRGVSLRWYEAVFENARLIGALRNSVLVAILSALVATTLGFLGGYGLARYRVRFSAAVQWLLMAPLSVSYLIIGMGLLITFNAVGVPKSLVTIGIGHVVINLPLAFGIIYSQFGEHQANIERAARDLGAAEWQVLTLVTVPMLEPALFASFCITATLSWDEFLIAFLLSRFDVTLPVEIWSMLRSGLNPETNAVGTLVFAFSISMIIVLEVVLMVRRRRN